MQLSMEGWYLKSIDCDRKALARAEILGSAVKGVGSAVFDVLGSVIVCLDSGVIR